MKLKINKASDLALTLFFLLTQGGQVWYQVQQNLPSSEKAKRHRFNTAAISTILLTGIFISASDLLSAITELSG
ncbi:hypothetical protein HAX54_034516 [Datura stramonium]|uniref:Uncharacterized protein n=1 Tax=Datura stramonium TaxID=4076 RepID=A0ABS8VH74_DATST|nr:hypothetical protein [Datura stramonium]